MNYIYQNWTHKICLKQFLKWFLSDDIGKNDISDNIKLLNFIKNF